MKVNIKSLFTIMNNSDDEDAVGAVSFMFDSEHSKELLTVSLSSDITISIRAISDVPGHYQSGQYLWPASIALSNYIIDNWEALSASAVVEIGSGCGLSNITISRLASNSKLYYTDYDRGSLDLIKDNIILNNNINDNSIEVLESNECTSISISNKDTNKLICSHYIYYLEWGKEITLLDDGSLTAGELGLIIGSDLIYCKEVVEPLFTTVRKLLLFTNNNNKARFILASSFSLDEESELELQRVLEEMRLVCQIIVKLNEAEGVSKIESYRLLD